MTCSINLPFNDTLAPHKLGVITPMKLNSFDIKFLFPFFFGLREINEVMVQ